MEALFVSGDIGGARENNTSQYRIFGPAKYLERAGHTIVHGNMAGRSRDHFEVGVVQIDALDWSLVRDVVLFERNITPERVDKLRAAGAKRIIVTFDDHYGLLPPYMASREYWKQNYKGFLRALGMVDEVVVPNVRLVNYFSAYARKITYLPNYLDPERWPEPATHREKIIGWGGSLGHVESWRNNNLQIAVRTFLKDHSDWRFRCFGPALPAEWMKRSSQIEHSTWVPFDEWPSRVNDFMIGLAPLSGEYDSYRSNLKLLEYQRLAIPWVASFDTPYSRPMRLSGGHLTRNSWLDELYALAASEDLRNSLAQAGRAESEQYLMSGHVADYETLLWG